MMEDILYHCLLILFNAIKVELKRVPVILLLRDSCLSKFPTHNLKAIFAFYFLRTDNTNIKTSLGRRQLETELSINESAN